MAATHEIRSVDRELLVAMRIGDAFGVGELTQTVGVTATAIRQRIERLLADARYCRMSLPITDVGFRRPSDVQARRANAL